MGTISGAASTSVTVNAGTTTGATTGATTTTTGTGATTGTASNLTTVTTLAGSGTAGYADGTGTAAAFSLTTPDNNIIPIGLAADAAGNVYVSDVVNQRIRKITPAGVETTLAGSGIAGFADGTGTTASFFNPRGLVVDSDGNVYVADSGNNRVRKITAAGLVTTLAGQTSGGATDGNLANATFNSPADLDMDSSGTIFVLDRGNNSIRKITQAGVVTTLAGGSAGAQDGTGTAASFSWPQGLAVDATGNVYVADSANFKIRKITPAGVVTTFAGSGSQNVPAGKTQDDTGTAATFSWPAGVALDGAGNLYVPDTFYGTIRKITPAGVVTTLAGTNDGAVDGSLSTAKFNRPTGIVVDTSGNVYVADSKNNSIRKIQ